MSSNTCVYFMAVYIADVLDYGELEWQYFEWLFQQLCFYWLYVFIILQTSEVTMENLKVNTLQAEEEFRQTITTLEKVLNRYTSDLLLWLLAVRKAF